MFHMQAGQLGMVGNMNMISLMNLKTLYAELTEPHTFLSMIMNWAKASIIRIALMTNQLSTYYLPHFAISDTKHAHIKIVDNKFEKLLDCYPAIVLYTIFIKLVVH